MQIAGDGGPHRVENEVDSLSTGELGRGHEVGIPPCSYQNDLVRLLLVCDGRDIEPDFHVDAFWSRVVHEIIVDKRIEIALAIEQLLKDMRSEPLAESLKIDGDGPCVSLSAKRRAAVVEASSGQPRISHTHSENHGRSHGR